MARSTLTGGLPEFIVGDKQESGKLDQGRVGWVMTDQGACVRINIVDWRPRHQFLTLLRSEVIGDFTLTSAKALHAQLGEVIAAAEARSRE